MSDISRYFSQNYKFATARFLADAKKFGEVKMYSDPESEYVVPVLKVGNGPNKVVINTGIHGTEGFFGSAFFSRWLENGAKFLDKKYNEKFTVALVHVINGFGMEHYVRENANNVDLNRNFCDWAADAPKNYMYRASHDLLVSKPGLWKLVKLLWFRYRHGDDGIWTAISRGQYEYPDGLFYGGDQIQPEYRIVQKIYDDVMADEGAKSLLSVGLHTGLGDYKIPAILVSHPTGHANVEKFTEIFAPDIEITPDEKGAVNAAELSGDLVDWLEARYANRHIPILTADLEIGTGTSWISPVLKRMDQGDAVWDVVHRGAVSAKTKHHLSESWAPRDKKWRQCSLWVADVFAEKLHKYMEKNL